MSMILDALKRADRERRRQEVEAPSLYAEHRPEPPPPTQTRRSWRTTVLVALALLALGTAIGLALSTYRAPDRGQETAQNNAQDQGRMVGNPAKAGQPDNANTQPSADTSQPVTAEREPPDQETSPTAIAQLYQSKQAPNRTPPSEVSRLYQQPERAEPSSSLQSEPAIKSEPRRAIPAPSQEPSRVSLPEPRETATVRLSAQEQTTVAPEPAGSPEPEAKSRPVAQPDETISIRELPWAMQQKIPSINYQAHHYRGGSNSTVTLNQKERRPGDEVSPDIRVEQIEADGVVLSYQGEKFKLKALNSWVNM